MIKYNEIMSHITVDPEMKSRVMSAVSNAIKENPDGAAVVTDIPESPKAEAPAKKKAKKTPIAIISSIAAAILILVGVLFVFRMMNGKQSAESTHRKNDKTYSWGYADSAENTQSPVHGGEALETENYDLDDEISKVISDDIAEDTTSGEDKSYSSHASDITLGDDVYTIMPTRDKNDYSTGMGDERLDIISRTLPFDLKGSGKGTFSSDISMEVFFGEQSQKVLLLSAAEGTDIIKQFDPTNKTLGTDGTTPAGTQVKYYRIVFGNVAELGKNETSSDINAALYNKDGMTYLLVFSDPQTPETIAALVDVI